MEGHWCNDTDRIKPKYWEKNPVPMPLCSPQIQNGLTWNQNRTFSGERPATKSHGRFFNMSLRFCVCRQTLIECALGCEIIGIFDNESIRKTRKTNKALIVTETRR
jgi:hypothetical protein